MFSQFIMAWRHAPDAQVSSPCALFLQSRSTIRCFSFGLDETTSASTQHCSARPLHLRSITPLRFFIEDRPTSCANDCYGIQLWHGPLQLHGWDQTQIITAFSDVSFCPCLRCILERKQRLSMGVLCIHTELGSVLVLGNEESNYQISRNDGHLPMNGGGCTQEHV